MAKVLDLINSVDSVNQFKDFTVGLLTSSSDLPLGEDINEIDSLIITKINSYLSKPDTRASGLVVISKFIPRCSKEDLQKYGMLWISKAVQVLESKCESKEFSLASRVLGELLIEAKQVPELQKEVSMQNVKPLVTLITSFDLETKGTAVLYPLAVLLYYYKESTEKFQKAIREFILPTVDSKKKETAKAGANIYSLLTRATERSFKSIEAKPAYNNWTYNLLLICNSLHEIMTTLFPDSDTSGPDEMKLELPSLSQEDIVDYYFDLEKRFENLCDYLSTMLRGCGEINSVIPNDILTLVCRGLDILPTTLHQEDSLVDSLLYMILPKLHIILFQVLNAFIEGFKDNLVPFASTVLKLYKHTLNWANGLDLENEETIRGIKPFTNVKISVYKSLTIWLNNLSTLSGIEIISDELIPLILKDITPEMSEISLTIQKTTATSKKGFKRTRDNQIKNDLEQDRPRLINKCMSIDLDICKEALISLQCIFKSSGTLMKIPIYQMIEELVIAMLSNVYMDDYSFYKLRPFCHVELLRLLKIMQMNPHPLRPSSLHHCIELFSTPSHEYNRHVAAEAKEALMQLEKIAHPSALTLSLPVVNAAE
ncbi:proline-, glutamic acid- and leucine-rich protein 1-like [Microplitis mediator]|uniref:proline-, glutamic acid- and leucine-rich protein 1-like n=1 Tax=Microplitis mediator TaxID=375433 RepID=UPI00255748BA|nr:proline-, glutamic acid- and leucine-rich protein 1-like [Microplitis mediator]